VVYRVRRASRTLQVGSAALEVAGGEKIERAASTRGVLVNYRRRRPRGACQPAPLARSTQRSAPRHMISNCNPPPEITAEEARARIAVLLLRDCGVSVEAHMIGGDNLEKFCRLLCESAGQSSKTCNVYELRSAENYKRYVRKLKQAVRKEQGPSAFIPTAVFPQHLPPALESQSNVFVSTHDARRWLWRMAEQVEIRRVGCIESAISCGNAAEVASAVYRSYFLRELCRSSLRHVSALVLAKLAEDLKESLRVAVALISHDITRSAEEPPAGPAEAADRMMAFMNGDCAAHRFSSAWQVASFVQELRRISGGEGFRSDDKSLGELLRTVSQLIGEAQQGKLALIEKILNGLEQERLRRQRRMAPGGARLKLVRVLEEARVVLVSALSTRGGV